MGKARSHYVLIVEPFADLFWALGIVSTLFLLGLPVVPYCQHLTQTAGLATLNRNTSSMSLYGHTASTVAEGGFNCISNDDGLCPSIAFLINL